jgi:hypothetical protein
MRPIPECVVHECSTGGASERYVRRSRVAGGQKLPRMRPTLTRFMRCLDCGQRDLTRCTRLGSLAATFLGSKVSNKSRQLRAGSPRCPVSKRRIRGVRHDSQNLLSAAREHHVSTRRRCCAWQECYSSGLPAPEPGPRACRDEYS